MNYAIYKVIAQRIEKSRKNGVDMCKLTIFNVTLRHDLLLAWIQNLNRIFFCNSNSLYAGSIAGLVQSFIACPTELVTIRLQTRNCKRLCDFFINLFFGSSMLSFI